MVKKKSFLQKLVSFATSAAMILTMGTLMSGSMMRAEAACATTAEVTAYIDNLKATKYAEGISWYNFYSDAESKAAYQGIQCVGFARHIAELLFDTQPGLGITSVSTGTVQKGWVAYRPSDVTELKPGDLIYTEEHAAVVHYVSGSNVYVIEAWGTYNNEIHYGYFNGSSSNKTLANIKSNFNFYGIWRHQNIVNGVAPAELSSITINPDSIGTIYEDGSEMDTSALSLTATYSDGSTKAITSGYSVTPPSLANVGTQSLTVSYEGKTASVDITVQDLFEGSGTESDPYLIGTDEELKLVADMVNNTAANDCYGRAYYRQTADIDLGLYNWIPIGNYTDSATSTTYHKNSVFKGHYDGNYHKVTNLKVNYNLVYAGLFGRLNYNVDGAIVENLSVSGDVIGGQSSVGGVVGEAGYGAVIRNCDFTGTVNGATHVGGIVGKAHQGAVISNCYANVEVTATDGCAGGISGAVSVAGSSYSTDVLIKNCYFAGKLSGTTVGGIAGATEIGTANDTTITFINNYYLNSAAGGAVAGAAQSGCMGLISSQLKTIAADLGSPFADNPYSILNDGYPVFEWQLVIEGDVNADGQFTVADLVILQKWLLCATDAALVDWQAADMCDDDIIDAFDLCIMKRELLSKS